MSGYFILAILALAFILTFQIAKASEYVSVLKGEQQNQCLSNDCVFGSGLSGSLVV